MKDAVTYAHLGDKKKPYSDVLFRSDLDKISNRFPIKGTALEDLYNCVIRCDRPDEYFDFIGHGSFKETYDLDDNYVVKFCSQQNDTKAEKALLEAAKREGVLVAFIPTEFVNFYGMTCQMPILIDDYAGDSCEYWDSEEETYVEDENWEGRYATDLEIQPMISSTCDNDKHWNFDKEDFDTTAPQVKSVYKNGVAYEYNIIDMDDGEKVRIEYSALRSIGIHSKEWIRQFINIWGIDMLYKLADFCDKYGIHDLHNKNIGYLKDRYTDDEKAYPVIIDWLSVGDWEIKRKMSDLH